MHRIVVIGGGGHAKVLISVLKKTIYEIVGYTDRQDRGAILGVSYLGNDDILLDLIRNHAQCNAIIGLGKIDASGLRNTLQKECEKLGFNFPTIVSPQAVINEEVKLGGGTVVFDGVVVNSGTETGRACILNTNCTIEHDCRIGDNVHIAPGATLSGGVDIGSNCMIGTGANVIQSICIEANSLIGAGSTVVKDISVPGTYVGNPARQI
jgi:sugar O-acyltransferase (sialic acid O-acetyltransferase NeuD family)